MPGNGPRGAYGLVPDLGDASWLTACPGTWVPWELRWVPGDDGTFEQQTWSADEATIRLLAGGWAVVDRVSSCTTLRIPTPPSAAALVHPYLGSTAVIAAHWSGRSSFHAGAFIAEGGAWGVLGDKEAGKTSLLAALAARHVPILADDLLVVDDGKVLAGPRCLDLRASAAESLGQGVALGVVGNRERWRVQLADVPAEVPLRGFIVLEWGDGFDIRAVPRAEQLARLAEHRGLRIPDDGASWLPLVTRPMLCVRRPRDLDRLASVTDQVLEGLRTGGW